MDLRFVGMANVFVYWPCLRKAKSAPARCVHGSVARPVAGISIVQLNCPRTSMLFGLEKLVRECWAKVEWGHGRILVRDGANAGWISYMLKDRQKSEFDGLLDCIIIESLHNPIADA